MLTQEEPAEFLSDSNLSSGSYQEPWNDEASTTLFTFFMVVLEIS